MYLKQKHFAFFYSVPFFLFLLVLFGTGIAMYYLMSQTQTTVSQASRATRLTAGDDVLSLEQDMAKLKKDVVVVDTLPKLEQKLSQ
ncbi:hypothetical protein A2973_03575 [Candidatus Gottesmanbacteria bacterium RIFCSPLOWO2_01_FULL_49_10]|uniref:Uncharacterized protein n=1 Tax=Candidatus Gottesmanbacteria bacterium RIFCSPLOWO2_01_FULL_49_10 TaxID=1798396 RepID=A0A1F6B0H2_9BACT|nr:MAG: hypothetical protein A2973_03575 [Candidatus Gottesmanbacteria bacterium RIFCSPLOWO2_01_FULL_49_10]